MSPDRDRFPYSWEVETPKGAEGWQRMYPYYFISREETREHEQSLFWVRAVMHNPRVMFPFDSCNLEGIQIAAGQFNSRVFTLPAAMGIDERLVNGYRYMAPIEITDPAEIEKRTALFLKRAGYYYAHWDELSTQWRTKTEANIREAEEIDFKPLPDIEPEEIITEGRGRSTGYDLLSGYNELMNRFFLMWQYHFELMNVGHAAFGHFFEFCKHTFPEISNQTVSRMVAGLDFLLYRPDDELKNLARRAIELNVQGVFERTSTGDEVIAEMGKTANGRAWIKTFDQVKHPWFYFSSGGNLYHDETSWIDDLTIPFTAIRRYIEKLDRGEDITRPVQKLREERDSITREYRAMLQRSEDKEQFDQMVNTTRTVFPFTQDHNFFGEHWFMTVFWQKMRAIGRALVDGGVLADPEDIFYLTRHEVGEVLFDVVGAWAIGVKPRGIPSWRDEVARRREIVAVLEEWKPLPALGKPPAMMTNPLIVGHCGITTEVVKGWLEGAGGQGTIELKGLPASAGTVEGIARVIQSRREVESLQPGDILVCQTTTPSWGPLLSRVGAIVADSGGMMCHSAIISREYGVPAVVGCSLATTTIKTGQRVRVDGERGIVLVLQ